MIPLPALRLSLGSVRLLAGVFCALLLVLLIHDRHRWKAKANDLAGRLAIEQAAHAATAANIRAASEQARRADAANSARVRAEQSTISERTRHDYEERIAAARAAADGLRQSANAAARAGNGAAAPVPSLSASPGRADDAAGEDQLSLADRLIATEQAIQLDELIKWVRAQSQVDMRGRQ